MGATRENATEGGGVSGRLGKVLLRVNTGGAIVWGGDVGVFCANGAEFRGSACGFPEMGDKVEGKEADLSSVAEGGGGKITSRSRDITTPDLLGQKTGNSGGMGVPTAHFRHMYEGYGLRGGG